MQEMLQEKQLARSTSWEKTLSTFIYDPRYTALPKQYRKLVFDDFMKKNAVDKIREEMRRRQVAARLAFRRSNDRSIP